MWKGVLRFKGNVGKGVEKCVGVWEGKGKCGELV